MRTSAGATDEAPTTHGTPTTDGTPTERPYGSAALYGLAAAAAVGLVWAVLSVVLDFHLGLLVVAAVGGWIVGAAVVRVARGAWPVAVGSAGLAWLVGAVLSYVLSQVLLPEAVTPLAERLSIGGLVDYTVATFDLVQTASIAILVVVAWRSAR